MSTYANAQIARRNKPAPVQPGLRYTDAGATAEQLVLRIVEATESAVRKIRQDTERALAEETEAIIAAAEHQAALIEAGAAEASAQPNAAGDPDPSARGERFHGLHSVPGPSLEPEFARGVAAEVRQVIDAAIDAAGDAAAAIRDDAERDALELRSEAERDAVRIRAEARTEGEAMRAEAAAARTTAERQSDRGRAERMHLEALASEVSANLSRIAADVTQQAIAAERSGGPERAVFVPALSEVSGAISRAGFEVGRLMNAPSGPLAAPATPAPADEALAHPAPQMQAEEAPPQPEARRIPRRPRSGQNPFLAPGPFQRTQARFAEQEKRHAYQIAADPPSRQAVR